MTDIITILMVVLLASTILCFFRVFFGPTAHDRLTATAAVSNNMLVIMILLGVSFAREIYLDIALTYAIFSFIGIVAFAKYLEGQGLHE